MFKCILVDDERWVGIDLQKSVHWMDYGFDLPTFFQQSQQALAEIAWQKPDVVFTDIRMPGLTGIDLIRRMRQQQIDSEIVILSAYEDFEVAQIALRSQVFDYCLKPINVPQIESLLEALVEKIRIKKAGGHNPSRPQGTYSEPIQKVIAYLEENLSTKITLAEVADHIYLNKNYLCTLFQKETGISFSEYATSLRIQKAKHLLQHTDMPITQIAKALAYCDHFYFTKVFKKKVGISPFEFRQELPNNASQI